MQWSSAASGDLQCSLSLLLVRVEALPSESALHYSGLLVLGSAAVKS